MRETHKHLGTQNLTRLIASASALLLTAGTAAAHTAEAAHSHNEMVIAVAAVVAVGAVVTRMIVRAR
ncbi:MAG: hypothetical protein CMM70_10540 [Rhodospirillaceae bacterium]|nr:hypothetical protein [Rhodospirillaceae bacterium]